jgi:tetratricopeptide (TPR) repeat protein
LKEYDLGKLDAPVVNMAETLVTIGKPRGKTARLPVFRSRNAPAPTELTPWRRWNDYGIALFEQAQYGAAFDIFMRAFETDRMNPDPLVSAANALLRMERYSDEREHVKQAAELIDQALRINPEAPRTRFYRAVTLRADGRLAEAAAEFADLARTFPRDREIHRQLGQTLFSLSRFREARPAFEAILKIDPTDAYSYQALASIYASEGLPKESMWAQQQYLLWRDDPFSEFIAGQFFVWNPQWAEVRIPFHVNSMFTPPRPTATGANATPIN